MRNNSFSVKEDCGSGRLRFCLTQATTDLYHTYMGLGQIPKKLIVLFIFLLGIPLFAYFFAATPQETGSKTLTLVESSPDDQENEFSVVGQPTFVFSQNIMAEEKDLANYFSISPSVNGKWNLEKNGKVVYFSAQKSEKETLPKLFSYDTIYTITLKKDLKATDGKKLADNATITFRTQKDPSFLIKTGSRLLVTSPDETPIITFYQKNQIKEQMSSSLFVTVENASKEDFLTYFTHKKDKNPLYILNKIEKAPLFTQTVPVVVFGSEYNSPRSSVTIPQKFASGIYVVTLQYPHRGWGEETFFMVSSNHIHTVVHDDKTVSVWTTDGGTGNILPNASVKFFSTVDSPKLVTSGTTDDQGIFTAPNNSYFDFVLTDIGNDIAISMVNTFEKTTDSFSVFSYADRPVYRPGNTIHYKAIIRQTDNGKYTIPKGKFYLCLANDFSWRELEQEKTYQEVLADENGSVTADFTLPAQTTNLSPSLVLAVKNNDKYIDIDTLYLTVESYRKPDMDIQVSTEEKEYISQDTAHLTITAKTLYGSPLTNTPFSYRVLAGPYAETKNRSQEFVVEKASTYYGYGKELTLGQGTFNDKGISKIEFSTNLAGFEESQIITIEITPGIGASPSIGKMAKLVHRGTFTLFFDEKKANVDDGIIGTITAFDHNSIRQPVPNQEITLSLYKIENYAEKKLVKEEKVTTSQDGSADFTFDKLPVGSYNITATGKDIRDNIVTNHFSIYVATKESQPLTTLQNPLSLTPNKKIYKPGETATITVSNNFPQNLLQIVSIAQEKGQYFQKLPRIQTITVSSDNTIRVPIPADGSYPRGIDVFTVYDHKVILAHANIDVDNSDKKLDVLVTFEKSIVSPGETVNAQILTKDHTGKPIMADVSLSLIDKAILQIGEINSNIFDSFYGGTPYSYILNTNSTTGISIFDGDGGGMGGCFLAGTKILMSDGREKNIEDITIDDSIKTRSSDTNSVLATDSVTRIFYHVVNYYLTINNKLKITPIHRIFVNGIWKQASDIKIGDYLLTQNNEFILVDKITPHYGNFPVYNLETKEKHTFFADGFYVHNSKGGEPRKEFADTAYWNPSVKTDKEGKATVSITIPDNLTTFTAQAIAQTPDSLFGQTTTELVSKKDFAIIPALAPFAFQDDTSYPSFLLHNNSSIDINATLEFFVKEQNIKENKTVFIPANEINNVSFPIAINTKNEKITYRLVVKDEKGQQLDEVEIAKPIIPQGDIVSSWESFEGKKDIEFSPVLPNLDFNSLTISVVPHHASNLFGSQFSEYYQTSSYLGQEIFAWSYILEQTKTGAIDPTIYKYAKSKNNFRRAVEKILQRRISSLDQKGNDLGSYWSSEYYNSSDSITGISLWVTLGLQEVYNRHLLDELSSTLEKVIEQSKKYLSAQRAQPKLLTFTSRDEVLFSLLTNNTKISPDALRKLKAESLPSANDRLLWDNQNNLESALPPALAFVEKGTKEDAEKAIKGLSIAKQSVGADPLTLLAAVKHAVKQNLLTKANRLSVTVNNKHIFEVKEFSDNNLPPSFSQTFVTSNLPLGKIAIKVWPQGNLPFYTTIVKTTYKTTKKDAQQMFPLLSSWLTKTSQAKVIEKALKRTFRLLPTGETVTSIPVNKSAAVVLSMKNKDVFGSSKTLDGMIGYLQATDVVNPAVMVLNQQGNNSPEYQSSLASIFPNNNNQNSYPLLPNDYSDQIALFAGTQPEDQLDTVLTYVVYQINQATNLQPKTNIVFPVLGIIVNEK